MKQRKDTKRKLHRNVSRTIFGFAASLVLLLVASMMLFAKYYAGNNDKGVATASSLYFSSNYLREVQGKAEADYPVTYNSDAWDGTGAYEFDLEIRNYQNQLLYNDKNLDITYRIEFKLIDASDNGIYSVVYQDEQKSITDSSACSYEVNLQGGQATANHFRVSINKPVDNDDINYKSVGVLVKATPISPSYMVNYGSLGGVLVASMISSQFELKGEFSDVTDTLDDFTGFVYNVTYKPGTSGSTRNIKIEWDSDRLQLDKNSKYFSEMTDSGENKKCISLTIEPYSSLDIVFYRTNSFYQDGYPIDKTGLQSLVNLVDEGGGTP